MKSCRAAVSLSSVSGRPAHNWFLFDIDGDAKALWQAQTEAIEKCRQIVFSSSRPLL
jgi:hypothetical protein